jgi:ribosomal-protein-alanine N-acetyltransferase
MQNFPARSNDDTETSTTSTGNTLHTARLQLVAPEARHLEAFATLHADAATMRYIGYGQALDRVESWLHLAMLVGHWQLRGYGVWMAEQAATGRFAGRIGLFHPDGWDEPELNWMIVPELRGQGLAVEAARAVRDFAFGTLGIASLISLIRPDNAASSRVALKAGAIAAETIDFLGGPIQVYRYRRPQ